MLKTFLGIDLKKGGLVILWIHLVENFLLFLIIGFRSHFIPKNSNHEFIVITNGYRIGKDKVKILKCIIFAKIN